MTKCAQHCVGKYVTRSEIEDAFIETKMLSKKLVEQFLNGTHYFRLLAAISILIDGIDLQKWEALWETHGINKYIKICYH